MIYLWNQINCNETTKTIAFGSTFHQMNNQLIRIYLNMFFEAKKEAKKKI